jgi:hypothetical protein
MEAVLEGHVRRQVTFMTGVIVMMGLMVSAGAQVSEESDLTAWAMDASLMVEGGPGRARTVRVAPCAAIHDAIDRYQAEPPTEDEIPPELSEFEWSEFMRHYDLSDGQIRSLRVRYDYSVGDIEICTTLHTNGWLQSEPRIVELAEAPPGIIEVTVAGETSCRHGQVLLASATYYWSIATRQWEYSFGTGWEENFFGGFTVTGDLAFRCIEIAPVDSDFAEVADAVPSSQVNYNPLVRGLTGLDTWFWYEFGTPDTYSIGPLEVTVNRYGRDWTLSAFAWLDSVHWDVDCESGCDFRGARVDWDSSGFELSYDFPDSPGAMAPFYDGGDDTEDDSLAMHLYEEKGFYTVSTATVWRGYYVSNGVPTLYDPVVVTTERPYEVVEIRGVLTSPDS